MNRRYTQFSQLKISGEPKPPESPKGGKAAMPAESTAAWPGPAGPMKSKTNGPSWKKVKQSAKVQGV